MRHEKRGTRNRVYTLVGALLVLGLAGLSLSLMLRAGRKKLDSRFYPYPHLVLGALCQAQERFRLRDLDGDGVRDYAASLAELEAVGIITAELAGGVVRGYRYDLGPAPQGGWRIAATPDVAAATSQSLSYWADASQVVRAAVGQPAPPSQPTSRAMSLAATVARPAMAVMRYMAPSMEAPPAMRP